MHRIKIVLCLGVLLFNSPPNQLGGQEINKDGLAEYRRAGLSGGNPAQGKTLFESDKVGCTKCHVVKGNERLAGPELRFIGDKYGREQLVESVLEPNATIHPDYGTVVATTTDGKLHRGVLRKRTDQELQLLDSLGKLVRLPVALIDDERRTATSLMPADLRLVLDGSDFAADPQRKARVSLVRGSAPTAARVSIKGGDNKPHAPAGGRSAPKTKRDES